MRPPRPMWVKSTSADWVDRGTMPLRRFWYRKAADQGNPRAQLRLGTLYEKGLGVERDPVRALDLYRKAAGLSEDKVVYSVSGPRRGTGIASRCSQQGGASSAGTGPVPADPLGAQQ